jgi:hypothetical protein
MERLGFPISVLGVLLTMYINKNKLRRNIRLRQTDTADN